MPSRSDHLPPTPPPPPPPPLLDPSRALLALPATLLALSLAYKLNLLPLELLLLGRATERRMWALFGWLFGASVATGGAGGGEGEGSELRQRARSERLAEVERYASLLPAADAPSSTLAGRHAGIVNMSGTFCFLNSVLQALASSPSILAYLHQTLSLPLSLPPSSPLPQTPVSSHLLALLLPLATPSPSHPRPLRPSDLVEALRASRAFAKAGVFGRLREQQDAHELWALLASSVDDERRAVDLALSRSIVGLKATAVGVEGEGGGGGGGGGKMNDPPWEGRMAYRRACAVCGYAEGIRLMQSGESTVPLTALLQQQTQIERLSDAQCRKCRVAKTCRTLRAKVVERSLLDGEGVEGAAVDEKKAPRSKSQGKQEQEAGKFLSKGAYDALALDDGRAAPRSSSGGGPTASARKRARADRREGERLKERLKEVERLMEEGRWEDEVEGVAWELVEGGVSTRHEMFASPPPLLVVHLNRSLYTSSSPFPLKNPILVTFTPQLDLSPLCTAGELSMDPDRPLTERAEGGGTLGALKEGGKAGEREVYDLVGFVNHLGAHASGHYITYRRIPFSSPPRWLCISDADVVDLPSGGGDEVWKWGGRGEVVLLFYERVGWGSTVEREKKGGPGRVIRSSSSSSSSSTTIPAVPLPSEHREHRTRSPTVSPEPPSVSPSPPPSPRPAREPTTVLSNPATPALTPPSTPDGPSTSPTDAVPDTAFEGEDEPEVPLTSGRPTAEDEGPVRGPQRQQQQRRGKRRKKGGSTSAAGRKH